MADLTGKVLGGRYRVQEFLGRGGVAEVYRAWDARRGIEVALKFLREDLAEDRAFVRRFRREAQVLEKLRHPNIVRYYGFEEMEGQAFLVMEFIRGVSLRRYLHELGRPLTVGEAVTVLEPVCKALHYAHAEGVLHCDVKPGNILLERGGRVVLSDFGIARWAEGGGSTVTVVGSPAYMAPEQVRGQGLGVWTDVYGLGVTVYEMLTLRRPFPGERGKGTTSERVLWEQMHIEPRSLRDHNPQVPVQVEEVVRRALRKEPGDRPGDVLEVLRGVAQGVKAEPLKGLEEGREKGVGERKGVARGERWLRGGWWYVGAVLLAGALVVGVFVGSGGGPERGRATDQVVETEVAEMTRGAERGTATAIAETARALETEVAEMTRGAEKGTATAIAATAQALETKVAEMTRVVERGTATAQALETEVAEMTRVAERGTATAIAATARALETKVAEMTRVAERATATERARATEKVWAATRVAQTATAQAEQISRAQTATAQAEQISRAQTATAQAAQISRAQTATAEASQHRCFEAVRRHWEHSGSGLGEVGGVVLDLAGRPFTGTQVRIQVEGSDFVRLIGISPDGMYNFCCLNWGSNLHVVDLVGPNITSTNYRFRIPGPRGKARVLVDFKEVPCR